MSSERLSKQQCHYTKVGLVFLVLASSFGCGGGNEVTRLAISGKVSMDGAAVADGSLSFIPVLSGPSSGAAVVNGAFEIAEDEGPVPGDYTVTLTVQVSKPLDPAAMEFTLPPTIEPQTITVLHPDQEFDLQFHQSNAPE